MPPVTRRRFLVTSALGAGLVNAGPSIAKLLAQTQSGSWITSNFNGTPIAAGDYIWFNSVFKVHGLDPLQGGTISFAPMPITFAANGSPVSIPVPSAIVNFIPGLAVATTDYVGGQWLTNVPSAGLAGNVFLDGVAFQVPAPGFSGGIKNVTWAGMFFSCTPGMTVNWQWAAAVYNNPAFLDQDLEGLGVKPVDDNHASAYQNSDHAGTPENFKAFVVGGARGGGGSNFTGSYSGTASGVPTPGSLTGCGGSP